MTTKTQTSPSEPALTAPPIELRRRSIDGRGVADIRLMRVEDGPGRGQRMFLVRNATGIGLEIAVDRGFDPSSATWRGVNIGWNSANGLPWPPHPVDAEDGLGFYRNLDGFIVTCGLDHFGGVRRASADRYLHKHRRGVLHPLHGRISSQRATIGGYGIDWSQEVPVIWAEATVRQSAVFGENLVLRRRIVVEVNGNAIRIKDQVENHGFRPTPHAMLYHINFGYPFLDQSTRLFGNLSPEVVAAFNAENKTPRDDFVDFYQQTPFSGDDPVASITLGNEALLDGVAVEVRFSRIDLPCIGLWRAYQSGVYALALEPAMQYEPVSDAADAIVILGPGDHARHGIELVLGKLERTVCSK